MSIADAPSRAVPSPTFGTASAVIAVLVLVFASGALAAAELPIERTRITVTTKPQQTFRGFGVSMTNPGKTVTDYGQLSKSTRHRLARQLWTEGEARIARLWLDLGTFNPAGGRYDLSEFERRFLTSGMLPDAIRAGCTTILLAPTNLPRHLRKNRKSRERNAMQLVDDASAVAYGQAVARAIIMLHQRHGLLVDATGVQNEPSSRVRLSPKQFVTATKALRRALDAAGKDYRQITIIGPETASVDQTCRTYLEALRADPEAWKAIGGLAGHSYTMCLTEKFAKRWLHQERDYWNTEAGNVETDPQGKPLPIMSRHGVSLAARALNDIRFGCSHWIWFLGYEHASYQVGDRHRLMRYREDGQIDLLPTYHYFKLLARSIPVGSTILESHSDRDLGQWTHGPKPSLYTAAARRPDGAVTVQLCNYSSAGFADRKKGTAFYRKNMGDPAKIERVTIVFDQHLGVSGGRVRVSRLSTRTADQAWAPSEQVIQVVDGVLTVDVRPMELVVVTATGATGKAEPAQQDRDQASSDRDEDAPGERGGKDLDHITITLQGQVEPGTRSMTIDGRAVDIGPTGRFKVDVPVLPGQNDLPVVIRMVDGEVITRQLQLTNAPAEVG